MNLKIRIENSAIRGFCKKIGIILIKIDYKINVIDLFNKFITE
jgi:hypothetical protein